MTRKRKEVTDVPAVRVIENGYDKEASLTEICMRLIEGESLRKICAREIRDPVTKKIKKVKNHLPSKSLVLKWLNADATEGDGKWVTSIAHARELQADGFADDILDMANEVRDGDLNGNDARVSIWAKQWLASKMRPKKYGEKIEVEHVGKVEKTDWTQITNEQQAEATYRALISRSHGA